MKTDIALARFGVLAHQQARADHRSSVSPAGYVHRHLREIEFVVLELHLFHWAVVEQDRFDAVTKPLGDKRHERLFIGAEGERGMAYIGGRLAKGTPAVGQILKEQGFIARLI